MRTRKKFNHIKYCVYWRRNNNDELVKEFKYEKVAKRFIDDNQVEEGELVLVQNNIAHNE